MQFNLRNNLKTPYLVSTDPEGGPDSNFGRHWTVAALQPNYLIPKICSVICIFSCFHIPVK